MNDLAEALQTFLHVAGGSYPDAAFKAEIALAKAGKTLPADAQIIADLAQALKTLLIALDAPTAFHPKLGPQWMGPAIGIAKTALTKAGL